MKRILRAGTAEVVEKKSRFIAVALDVNSGEEALDKVNLIRKKYFDARHNCYAYVCGEDGEDKRFSDDGEPSGTAGKPMMDVLEGSGVTNCLIVVTRYFGGTLLGTGGLVKAYGSAAKLALENAETTEIVCGIRCRILADYNSLGKLQYILAGMEVPTISISYEENVMLEMAVPAAALARLEASVTDAFAGNLKVEQEEKIQFYVSGTETVVL